MKIIVVDNYNREHVSDILVAGTVSKYFAELIVNKLNASEGEHSDTYYKAVPDDYVLYVFDPNE